MRVQLERRGFELAGLCQDRHRKPADWENDRDSLI